MEKYDYRYEIESDLHTYIYDNVDINDFDSVEELEEYLYEETWAEDSITGNGPYGYASEEECCEYVCHNFDILNEAIEEGFCEPLTELNGKKIDCIIRCYLLGECTARVAQDFAKQIERTK